jgi:uncharacterized integral membrane protein
MKIVFWVIVAVILVITIDFVMTNGQPVQFGSWFLPWQTEIPAGLAVLLALAFGLLIGGFMAWMAGHQARRRARAAEREVEHLHRELSTLVQRTEHAERDAIAVALPEPEAGSQNDSTDRRDTAAGSGRA